MQYSIQSSWINQKENTRVIQDFLCSHFIGIWQG